MAARLIPGLGMLDLDQMRVDLDVWREHARVLLEERRWTPAFVRYPRLDFSAAPPPFAAVSTDLRQARILLIGSAGVTAPGQQPFDAQDVLGDYSFRLIPSNLNVNRMTLSHDHYDHTAADTDRNVVFPLERLRDMVSAGEIGALTDHHIAFMGYQPDYVMLIETFLPQLMDAALEQRADLALLVPV